MCRWTLNTSVFSWLASANSFSIYICENYKQKEGNPGCMPLGALPALVPDRQLFGRNTRFVVVCFFSNEVAR